MAVKKKAANEVLEKMPPAPAWLAEGARKHFRELAPSLVADRVLWSSNVPRLALACKYFDLALTAEKFDEQKKACDEYMKLMKYFDDLRKPQTQAKTAKAQADDADPRFMELFG